MIDHPLLPLTVGIIAFLYASVGHAGASGYIAAMSLFGMAPDVIRPTALTLNILVASLATWQFWRAGYFSWALFWPFALLSVPCAFVGGWLSLPAGVFKAMVGAVLWLSAWRLVGQNEDPHAIHAPATGLALGLGAGLGFVAGVTGTGGGIFLTPLLLLQRWAHTKSAAGVSAAFILVNSIAGMAGVATAAARTPPVAGALILAAGAGGVAGAYLGSGPLPQLAVRRLLAVVLLIAGAKLLFGA